MKTYSAPAVGPRVEVRAADPAARTALAAAVGRSAELWRRVENPDAHVPGLSWSAAETAAHVVGDLREYTRALTDYVHGTAAADVGNGSPARLRTAVNDHHLTVVPERDMIRLADLLEDAAASYLTAAAELGVADRATIATPDGLALEPAVMTCLLLGEQVVHGLDIARSAGQRWPISRDDALFVIPAMMTLAPSYLRPSRSKGLHVSFELRMRGGNRYRFTVDDGTGVLSAAGGRADCVITADPVAFLLLGFGRIPQWSPVLRGQLRAGGRKPWLAARFGSLLASP